MSYSKTDDFSGQIYYFMFSHINIDVAGVDATCVR